MTEPFELLNQQMAPLVRMQFNRDGDRWAHQIYLSMGASEQPFMRSLEGTADQIWPPSPPLQDVGRHELPTGDAILCVGMAGSSHWSASFSVEAGVKAGENGLIKSDIACLTKKLTGDRALGSSYRLSSDVRPTLVSKIHAEFGIGSERIVVIKAIDGDGFSTVLTIEDGVFCAAPEQIVDDAKVATRWGFEIGIRLN